MKNILAILKLLRDFIILVALCPIVIVNGTVLVIATRIRRFTDKRLRKILPVRAICVSDDTIEAVLKRYNFLPMMKDVIESLQVNTTRAEIVVIAPSDTSWLRGAGDYPSMTEFFSTDVLRNIGKELCGRPLKLCTTDVAIASIPKVRGAMIPIIDEESENVLLIASGKEGSRKWVGANLIDRKNVLGDKHIQYAFMVG